MKSTIAFNEVLGSELAEVEMEVLCGGEESYYEEPSYYDFYIEEYGGYYSDLEREYNEFLAGQTPVEGAHQCYQDATRIEELWYQYGNGGGGG